MLVVTGVGINKGQLPGYNTFKLDLADYKVKELHETSIDITEAYGADAVPAVGTLPLYEIDFSADYAVHDLTARSLAGAMRRFISASDAPQDDPIRFLSERMGFQPTDSVSFDQGKDLAESWGLLTEDQTSAAYFYCQNTSNKSAAEIRECLQRRAAAQPNNVLSARSPRSELMT